MPTSPAAERASSGSLVTVLVAFAANLLIAVAKSVAAALTGSAAMLAEAAHSWADAGNEVFLLVAERRGSRRRDARHPLGYGREAYVWSMFAAFGIFTAGSVVSITHGVSQLGSDEGEADVGIAFAVLGVAFVLEGVSFLQALRQARGLGRLRGVPALRVIDRSSDPTLRAVFVEDGAALVGLLLAAGGIGMHHLTGEAWWDAAGSIAVGVLLGVVAVFLIARNRDFLVGQAPSLAARQRALDRLLAEPEVDRVTLLHLEYVGPGRVLLVAAVDLAGDDAESALAVRLRGLEARLEGSPLVEEAVLTLSTADESSIVRVEPFDGEDG